MRPELVHRLLCPSPDCEGAEMELHAHHTVTLPYRIGPIDEVQEGDLTCPACTRSYPITEYVPSFESLFPEDLREEAKYWSAWYGFWWQREQLGFFDLSAPRAPLINQGIEVLDPISVGVGAGRAAHPLLTEDPLVKEARCLLDIGCGTGWSSLLLAQQGHEVVAFDPSVANMRLAKSYAIAQGEYIEYVGAALGYLRFKPTSFDGVVALHAIHHVPNIREEIMKLKGWLHDGGIIAVDEHVGTNATMLAISRAMFRWADVEIYPKARTRDPKELFGLPESAHSALEGAGSEGLIQALLDNFRVESFSSRYVSLDFYSFLYYLWRDQDQAAYQYAADVSSRLSGLLVEAFPEGAEYVTLVGRKEATVPGKSLTTTILPAANPLDATRASDARSPERNRLRILMLKAERASLDRKVLTLSMEVSKLRKSVNDKNNHIERLSAWAASLEGAVKWKNYELERQERMLNVLPKVVLMLLGFLATRPRKAPGKHPRKERGAA